MQRLYKTEHPPCPVFELIPPENIDFWRLFQTDPPLRPVLEFILPRTHIFRDTDVQIVFKMDPPLYPVLELITPRTRVQRHKCSETLQDGSSNVFSPRTHTTKDFDTTENTDV